MKKLIEETSSYTFVLHSEAHLDWQIVLPENLSPSITRSLPPQPHVVCSLTPLSLSPLSLSLPPSLPPSVPLPPLLSPSFLSGSLCSPSLPLPGLIPSVCHANEFGITTSPCADHMLHSLLSLSPFLSLSYSLLFFPSLFLWWDQKTEAALCLENRNH